MLDREYTLLLIRKCVLFNAGHLQLMAENLSHYTDMSPNNDIDRLSSIYRRIDTSLNS